MQIQLSKFVAFLTGVASIVFLGAFGYFLYLVLFSGPSVESSPTIASINPANFGPKVQKAATLVKDVNDKKIRLSKNDITFTDSLLFKSFTDIPDAIPLSETRGRDDPFVPYVAP